MVKSNPDPDLAAFFAAEHAATGEHCGVEELTAYLAGDLPPAEARRLQDHLEGCRECVAQLLDLETLAQPEVPRTDGVADFELAAAWRTFKARRAEDERPVARPLRWLAVAAAVLLVATLALSVRVLQLQRSQDELGTALAQLREPQLNVPVVYLDATRSQGEVDGLVALAPEEDFFVVMLMPTDRRDFPGYEIEILDSAGRPIWRGTGLKMSEYGSLRVGLSRHFLPAGEYRVRLYGLGGEDKERIEDYALEIR